MNKLVVFAFALILCGCQKSLTPEEEAAQISAEKEANVQNALKRVEALQTQMHACDKNDGIADVIDTNCYKYGCGAVLVTCKDGMSRQFNR